MLITVVYNRVETLLYGKKEDVLADNDTIIMAKIVAKTLAAGDYQTRLLNLDQKAVKNLSRIKTDVFFNLCGGIDSLPHSESLAAAALAKTGRPVVGSSSNAINLTTDKAATKKLLLENNLPTPRYLVVPNHHSDLSSLRFPVILKPEAEDCSLGISQESVFETKTGISQKVLELLKLYNEPVLIEEYIDGRELRVSIVGNGKNRQVLPISELVFGKTFKNKFKIFDFSAKWLPKSTAYEDTYAVAPAKLTNATRKYIEGISLAAFAQTGCTDYGRIDIRLDRNNQPYILEVNANPAIGPDDALATSAQVVGISYSQLLDQIIQATLQRTTRNENYYPLQSRL